MALTQNEIKFLLRFCHLVFERVFVIFSDVSLQVASSNVLVEKMKKSEREVIQDWLENIFKSWEKTNDLEVTLFKFTPLKRGDASLVSGGDDHEWWWWGLKLKDQNNADVNSDVRVRLVFDQS